jgi:hypothetical protein
MTLGDNDDKELWTLLEFKTFFPQVVRALFARAFSATVLPCGGAGLSEGDLGENTHSNEKQISVCPGVRSQLHNRLWSWAAGLG